MEVPGKKASRDQVMASAQYTPVTCQPCGRSSKQVPAKSYCNDCKEYLCNQCCNDHMKFAVLMHHRLSDISDTHVATRNNQGSKPTINCKLHTDKLVEFYCRKHNVTACGACVVLDHVSCRSEYIPDISLDYKNSDNFLHINNNLERLVKHVTEFIQGTEDSIKRTKENSQHLIADIKRYRKEINQYLDRKEKELEDKTDKLQNADLKKLGQMKDDFDKYKTDLTEAKSYIAKLRGQSSDLFIASTHMKTMIEDIHARIIKTIGENKAYTYRFIQVDASKDLLAAKNGLGFVTNGEPIQKAFEVPITGRLSQVIDDGQTAQTAKQINFMNCQPVKQPHVNICSRKDQNDCDIVGMEFIYPNTLLLADYDNNCVKRVDTDTGNVTGYLTLPSYPSKITALGRNQVAVTLPNLQSIQVISTRADLSLLRIIKVDGNCRGICSTTDNKLVVSFIWPGKLQVLNERGTVLREIKSQTETTLQRFLPIHVIVVSENDKNVIYVSDYTGSLIKFSMTGRVLLTYEDVDLIKPNGLTATDDGDVLVCGQESHNVQVVSNSGTKERTLLCKKDGIKKPRTVCYNALKNTVYVGCSGSSQIEVYLLS